MTDTGFKVKGVDLVTIFEPKTSGVDIITGYVSSSRGKDLGAIFQAYVSGTKADATNYTISTGEDLNTLFVLFHIQLMVQVIILHLQ